MKHLRKITAIIILFVLTFMVLAFFRAQSGDGLPMLPDQFEIFWSEDWSIATIDAAQAAELIKTEHEAHNALQEKIHSIFTQGNAHKTSLPYRGTSKAGDLIIFRNKLPREHAGLTLNFTSKDANVYVYLDGTVIYEHTYTAKKHTEKPHETFENYINIPNTFDEGELWITMSSPSADTAAVLEQVLIESRDRVVIGVVSNNIVDIGCSILILLMAIIMFVLTLIRKYTRQPARGELFLGLAGLAAGIYCFIGTDTLSIFYDVQEAYEMQEYLILLLPIFLALYFERNLHTVYPRRFSVLLFLVIGNAVLQILLQSLKIRTLEQMVNVSALVVFIVCVTAIVSLLHYDYRHKRRHTLFSVLSLLILLAGGIVNIIMNTIFQYTRNNTGGQYSMALFAIMMAAMHTLQISKEYRASAEEHAQELKEKVAMTEQQNQQLIQAKRDADAARREALAANEAKGKFLAHMSHEIRTPINAVLGMDEMILRESKEPPIREYAMDIYMAGQTLLSLINDILDFSKIESGKMEIVPVEYDISSLIHDLANMAAQRAENKGLKFEVSVEREIPARLYGDDVRLRQVLTNILTNAVKYTHEGTVRLHVRCHRMEQTAILYFEVEDTGIGIKEEDLPKLSAEFERIEEDRNRNIEGSGLGMSITKQLLELLGSRLKVESIYGKGSKFYFEIEQPIVDHTPIGDFETRVRQIAENYNYTTKFLAPEAKILVVDDNAVNRKVLHNLLKETQIQVTGAESGKKCLELVQEFRYDLIFLDHMMPEMDGIETLHHLKALSDYPCKDTPVVVLTANAVSGAKENYLAEGFDDFLSKPIVPEKLEAMIKKMLPQSLIQELAAGNRQSDSQQQEKTNVRNELPEELPPVDGLDWNYAWLHLPDQELLEFTVKEFYAQIDPAAEILEEAYQKLADSKQQLNQQVKEPSPLDQYRIQVHAMKSLAATLGIIPLAGLAKILEYAARDNNTDLIYSLTGTFLKEWRSYREKLHGVFGIAAEAKKEVTDYSVMQALIEMLRLSMQEMDIDQADQLAGQLQTYEYPDEIAANIQKLAQAVTNLDAKEADRLAVLLIEQMNQSYSI
ncbi:MAG: response regulator [Lachnospiraceae bacterium]|nr:response regulator [Lachnospiraceae bacterium]